MAPLDRDRSKNKAPSQDEAAAIFLQIRWIVLERDRGLAKADEAVLVSAPPQPLETVLFSRRSP